MYTFQFQSQCPFGQTCQNGGCMLGGIGGCTVSLYCFLLSNNITYNYLHYIYVLSKV